MAGLEELDNECEKKKLKEIIASLDFMLFVYNHDKKSFARFLYDKTAFTCKYYKENGQCSFSSVANNKPSKERCEHQFSRQDCVEYIQKIFNTSNENAIELYNLMADDGYFYSDRCKQYNGGPLSVVFNTPSYSNGFYWNIEKLAGKSDIFSVEILIEIYKR